MPHWLWGPLFSLFFVGLLLLDLLVFQKKAHTVPAKEALLLTSFWISLALLFDVGIYFLRGHDLALKFLAGYLLEYSLSIDNIFVFLLIFTYFQVPPQYQHKALFWGILGAQIMRALFIITGITLINKFHWIIYVFGVFLIYTGIKLLGEKDKNIKPEKNPVLRIFKRFMPVTEGYENGNFFVRRGKRLFATPLFIVLLVLESTDVVFAVDSIPAILAITTNTFIVYTSNMFAILGLRSLYFALAALMRLFHYLNYGLAFILMFVGIKMLIHDFYHVPILAALGVILGTLTLSVIASVLFPKKTHH